MLRKWLSQPHHEATETRPWWVGKAARLSTMGLLGKITFLEPSRDRVITLQFGTIQLRKLRESTGKTGQDQRKTVPTGNESLCSGF